MPEPITARHARPNSGKPPLRRYHVWQSPEKRSAPRVIARRPMPAWIVMPFRILIGPSNYARIRAALLREPAK